MKNYVIIASLFLLNAMAINGVIMGSHHNLALNLSIFDSVFALCVFIYAAIKLFHTLLNSLK